jgi:hypothetical protein
MKLSVKKINLRHKVSLNSVDEAAICAADQWECKYLPINGSTSTCQSTGVQVPAAL